MNRLMCTNGTERPAFGRLFNELLSDPFFGTAGQPVIAISRVDEKGDLALDVSETEQDVIVRASLPGFGRDEVNVEIHEGVLSIDASHTEDVEETGEKFHRRERRFGSLSRRIKLPAHVDDAGTTGELKDGVLTLRLPKVVKAQSRKVTIS